MLAYAFLAAACFAKLFLAGTQMKNVQRNRIFATAVVSMLMTILDVLFVRIVAGAKDPIAVYIIAGAANAAGIASSVAWHRRHEKAHK